MLNLSLNLGIRARVLFLCLISSIYLKQNSLIAMDSPEDEVASPSYFKELIAHPKEALQRLEAIYDHRLGMDQPMAVYSRPINDLILQLQFIKNKFTPAEKKIIALIDKFIKEIEQELDSEKELTMSGGLKIVVRSLYLMDIIHTCYPAIEDPSKSIYNRVIKLGDIAARRMFQNILEYISENSKTLNILEMIGSINVYLQVNYLSYFDQINNENLIIGIYFDNFERDLITVAEYFLKNRLGVFFPTIEELNEEDVTTAIILGTHPIGLWDIVKKDCLTANYDGLSAILSVNSSHDLGHAISSANSFTQEEKLHFLALSQKFPKVSFMFFHEVTHTESKLLHAKFLDPTFTYDSLTADRLRTYLNTNSSIDKTRVKIERRLKYFNKKKVFDNEYCDLAQANMDEFFEGLKRLVIEN